MAYEGYSAVRVAVDRGVASVTIDHPPINLLDMTLIGELDRAGRELETDPAVTVVVLQSANRDFFVAHADVTLIQQLPAEAPQRSEKLGFFHVMVDRFRTMPKATIAKIAGRCRGGGSELALSCDMRFAALDTAVLGQPEVGVGIIPGGSGSVHLPRLVGRGRALEIILGCGDFDAATAEASGATTLPLALGASRQPRHLTAVGGIAGGTLPFNYLVVPNELAIASTFYRSIPELTEVITVAESGASGRAIPTR